MKILGLRKMMFDRVETREEKDFTLADELFVAQATVMSEIINKYGMGKSHEIVSLYNNIFNEKINELKRIDKETIRKAKDEVISEIKGEKNEIL